MQLLKKLSAELQNELFSQPSTLTFLVAACGIKGFMQFQAILRMLSVARVMFCGLEFQVLFSAVLENHCSSMDKLIPCLVFLICKLNMIASLNDSLRKHCIFWITVGLMRVIWKYKLLYLRWLCFLCVYDMNVCMCMFYIRSI